MDIKKKINVTRNQNMRLEYKLKILEKEIKDRDDLISEIVAKLDNNQPNFNNFIHAKTIYNSKNRPSTAKSPSNTTEIKNMTRSS